MRTIPLRGEVWFVDLGLVAKPRHALVLAAQTNARLALAPQSGFCFSIFEPAEVRPRRSQERSAARWF
jgi:hypothetical protein